MPVITSGSPEIPDGSAVNPITPENTPAGSFGDIAKASFENNPTNKLYDWAYSKGLASRPDEPQLTPEQVKNQYGVDTDQAMPQSMAEYSQRRQNAEKTYEAVSTNAPWYKKFGADSAAFFMDPLNDATMLIPGLGEERVAGALGAAGVDTASGIGKVATRAISGAGTLAAAQAPISALNYGLNSAAHMDATIAGAVRETLFAGAIGAITGPLAGAIKDGIKGSDWWKGLTETSYKDNEAIARTGINQFKEEMPVDIMPIYKGVETRSGQVFRDTRGEGVQYHGSTREIPQLKEASYDSSNIYGQGFYTSDAADIVHGYANIKGAENPSLYKVNEKTPSNLLDMEGPIPDDIKAHINSKGSPLVQDALEDSNSVRDLYNNIRAYSVNHGADRHEVQEEFGILNEKLEQQGYNGLTHTGGLITNKEPHKVNIYFSPHRDLELEKVGEHNFTGDEPSMQQLAQKQANYIKEGTVMGMPQEQLQRVMKAADDVASTPVKESNQELADARQEADDLEQSLRAQHEGNAELQKEFSDIDASHEEENITAKVYNTITNCLSGVGYV